MARATDLLPELAGPPGDPYTALARPRFRAKDGPFRVVYYPDNPLYRIENAGEHNGSFYLREGASPSGETREELELSFQAYRKAAAAPWIALVEDHRHPSGYRFEAFRPTAKWVDVEPASIDDYRFTYRVGRTPDGEMNVYQCFYAWCDTSQEVFEGIQGACSAGYSERDFIADLKLYLAAFDKPCLRLP